MEASKTSSLILIHTGAQVRLSSGWAISMVLVTPFAGSPQITRLSKYPISVAQLTRYLANQFHAFAPITLTNTFRNGAWGGRSPPLLGANVVTAN
eukprot:100857-Prymnesium_polylepis.1